MRFFIDCIVFYIKLVWVRFLYVFMGGTLFLFWIGGISSHKENLFTGIILGTLAWTGFFLIPIKIIRWLYNYFKYTVFSSNSPKKKKGYKRYCILILLCFSLNLYGQNKLKRDTLNIQKQNINIEEEICINYLDQNYKKYYIHDEKGIIEVILIRDKEGDYIPIQRKRIYKTPKQYDERYYNYFGKEYKEFQRKQGIYED